MITAVEKIATIKKARQLLVDKDWVQRASAMTQSGISVSSCHPDAVSFCALGAIGRVTRALDRPDNWPLFDEVIRAVESCVDTSAIGDPYAIGSVIAFFNDNVAKTKDDVLALFDAAIAKLEAEVRQ